MISKTGIYSLYISVCPPRPSAGVPHSDQQVGQLSDEAEIALRISLIRRLRLTLHSHSVKKRTFCGCNSVCFSPRSSPFITVNLPSSSAKKFRKVVGKETCSETLESTPTLEKAKFPQDYFPEVGFVINTHDWLTAFSRDAGWQMFYLQWKVMCAQNVYFLMY